MMLIAQ